MKILISVNTTWNLVNFRSGLIKTLVSQGYEVVAAAPADRYVSEVKELGCRYVFLPMDNTGTNPARDFVLFWRYLLLMRRERPDAFLGYTVKPNIYGSLAARLVQVPVINNVAGLGTVFQKQGVLNLLVRMLYRLALQRSHRVFFQNGDDRQLFIAGRLADERVSDQLPGSGVDLKKFEVAPMPASSVIRFLLVARMLREKGVFEYVEAARLLRQRGLNAEFSLLGFLNAANPSAIPKQQMDEWVDEGVVRYLGVSDNVCEQIASAHCIVLPSFYREGTPKTLLEALAIGRPIITTDNVGCRDVVDDGVNGFLCRPRDAQDLAEKMKQIAALLPFELEAMGLRGREKVEREFDQKIVIDKYLDAIAGIEKTA